MRSFFVLAVAGVAMALSATATQAATLNFTGNMDATSQSPFLAGGTFTLQIEFPEAINSGTSSTATSSTFSAQRAGGGTLNYDKANLGQLNLTFGKSGSNDTLAISGIYTPVTTGQPTLGLLNLVFTRAQTSGTTLVMNAANIATMLSNPTTYSGTFIQTNDGTNAVSTAFLSGTIPVPEPGSISLLAGLGLVCGRRVWRRRQQKQGAAV